MKHETLYYCEALNLLLEVGGTDCWYAFMWGTSTEKDAVIFKQGEKSSVRNWLYNHGFKKVGEI